MSGSGGSVPLGSLELEYRTGDNTPTGSDIKPEFNLKNTGTAAVPLSEVTIRYYYSMESGTPPQVFVCDYATIGAANISATFGTISSTEASDYLEVGFQVAAGSLAAGDQTGEILGRFNWSDNATVDETNDYSYDATKTAFTSWNKVTAYHNGTLIWGIEPP